MAVLNGKSAGATMVGFGAVTPGTCLNVVWRAFGSPRSDGKGNGYQWATDALARARVENAIKGTNLNDAPEGAVLYWTNVMGTWPYNGGRKYGDAGHVAIKGPGNTVITIDQPTRGKVGQVSVAQFVRTWPHLKFAGYAYGPGAFLGHDVATVNTVANNLSPAPAAVASKPIPTEEEDMNTVLIGIGGPQGGIWLVDHAQRTRWNIGKVGSTKDAYAYKEWLQSQGVKFLDKQPPQYILSYTDITNR
jgi:hypothetical protein